MRIVQLSDFHLSKDNMEDLGNYYIEALVSDLKRINDLEAIDIILITGDLVDKGGESLGDNPYGIFEDKIISPITLGLGFNAANILFIPGNHDIKRSHIDEIHEYYLKGNLNKDKANQELLKIRADFTQTNNRVKPFKDFEADFHKSTPEYKYSNNESMIVKEFDQRKVGIALINDSWRCSSNLEKEAHLFGYNQLHNAKRYFGDNDTTLNIAVFHHPLDAFNTEEKEEVENILNSQYFDIVFFGHSHKHAAYSMNSSTGGYLAVMGRAALNDPKEISSRFQPGYNILDINLGNKSYTLSAQKFIRTGFRFDIDTDSIPGGSYFGNLPKKNNYYALADQSNNIDNELPNSYTADVKKIVSLLIGKSLYPNPYIFVRELIQNSVDACNRVKEKHTHLSPKIFINLDRTENYIEVVDEGDGMTKAIIKNHFSVIGKSISQDFNDNSGHFNLISQFGIGFISTFIVAEKVIVNTKHDGEDNVVFEVQDVFEGFNYLTPSSLPLQTNSGTSIRVYFKHGFTADVAYQQIHHYCRHINGLEVTFNSTKVQKNESWNTENTLYTFNNSNIKYDIRLGISANSRPLIASYCGFFITLTPHAILPHRFPPIIGGEINFNPKGIDFDLSRSNIIVSPKSESTRKEISISLRNLFRQALEECNNEKVISEVVKYLQYYLQDFDANNALMQESYSDFYSKKELIRLCSDYTEVDYQGVRKSLTQVLSKLKRTELKKIFFRSSIISDYDAIVVQYLENKGFLVVENLFFNVSFHTASYQVALRTVFEIIGNDIGINVLEFGKVEDDDLKDMKMNKSEFTGKLLELIEGIESKYNIKVDIGKFTQASKPSVSNEKQYFLNYDHAAFQSVIDNINVLSFDLAQTYILGLLGINLDNLEAK